MGCNERISNNKDSGQSGFRSSTPDGAAGADEDEDEGGRAYITWSVIRTGEGNMGMRVLCNS